MHEHIGPGSAKYMDELTSEVYAAVDFLMNMNTPVIASVHGFAYGAAWNLVLACDLAVAAEGTVFCESFIKLGLIPGGHATTLLPRAVGAKRAAELCLTAREVDADEALSLGLVNKVVKKDELESETMKLAGRIAALPPLAVVESKKLLRSYYENSHQKQAAIERTTQIRMASSKDFAEGVAAFVEKRKPEFIGE